MIFLKIFNLGAIFLLCIYIGYYKAKLCEERVIELQKFLSGIMVFKNKVEFTYEPINCIFEDISNLIYGNKENVFRVVQNNKENIDINALWENAADKIVNINNEDKEIIKMFGKLLGKTDIKGQLGQIELATKLIEKQIEKAEIEKNKNFKVYKAMGMITGIGICIILV